MPPLFRKLFGGERDFRVPDELKPREKNVKEIITHLHRAEAKDIARAHPEVIAAYMPMFEKSFDFYKDEIIDLAKYCPEHAVALKDILTKNEALFMDYAISAEALQDYDRQNLKKIIPGTRISGSKNPQEIENFY